MKIKLDYFFVVILFIMMLSLPLGILLSEKPDALYFENRIPAAFPEPEMKSILDGSYVSMLDTYIGDRTTFRNAFIFLKTAIDLGLNRPVVNDMLIQDELILPYHGYSRWELGYIADNAETMAYNLAGVKAAAAEYGGELYYLGLPEQYSYFGNEYPYYMDSRSWVLDEIHEKFFGALSKYDIEYIDMISVYETLGRPTEFYSLSDHHYTYRGMLVAYQELMHRIGQDSSVPLKIYSVDDFTSTALPNRFLGSLNRKLYGLWRGDERLDIFQLAEPIEFTRHDNGKKTDSSLYLIPPAGERVTYNVYMGGDIGRTVIQTNRPELPTLLIWGDSYSNLLETVIWASFDEMHSLDLRYYNEMTLKEYIAEYKPDIVVCVRDDISFLDFAGNGNISG